VRRLLLCAVMPLLLVACGTETTPTNVAAPGPTPTPTAAEEPTPAPTPTPTPTPTPGTLAPLTGLPLDDLAAAERPVMAVKVDNLAPARPQAGLEDADIVMVELVEGATRFVALYHSSDPGVVGPVRSGRLAEADLMPPFTPIYVMSGAHGPVAQELRTALEVVYEEGQGAGWFRDSARRAPHNLFATATDLWAAAPDLPVPETFWAFEADAPAGGAGAGSLRATYPRAGASGWEWDDAGGEWLRFQDGAAHVSADGAQLAADNVVVARMEPTGNERRPFEPLGEGPATVFRDGEQFEARWRKPTRGDHLEVLAPDGEAFPLRPGRTWLELLPTTGELTVDTPA
jgi:hypothetical protein